MVGYYFEVRGKDRGEGRRETGVICVKCIVCSVSYVVCQGETPFSHTVPNSSHPLLISSSLLPLLLFYNQDQPLWDVSAARAASHASPPSRTPTDWVAAMRGLPASAAGKGQYVSWLRRRYANGTRAGLEQARAVYNIPASVQTWDALISWDFGTVAATSSAVLAEDTLFLGVVAERLFGVGAAAVRRHDPGALVFGQRFLSHDAPAVVLAAAGRHFDVVSVQPSMFSPESRAAVEASAERLGNISRLAGGKPVFVADQATHFQEKSGPMQPNCGETTCVSEAEAGVLYGDFLAALQRRPAVVGYAHCQYINRVVDPGGDTSRQHLKQGLLHADGTPHREMVDAITLANAKASTRRPEDDNALKK